MMIAALFPNPSDFIWQIMLLPLLGAFLIMLFSRHPNLREGATLLTAITTFAFICLMVNDFAQGQVFAFALPDIIPNLNIAWRLEPLGALFALIASGLWIINSLYSFGYMRGNQEKNQTSFYAFFAIAIMATLGIALSANLLTLFIFYEILSLSTWPLVAHKRDLDARYGGRVYLSFLLGTSIGLFLPAMLWLWTQTQSLDFVAGGLLATLSDEQAISALTPTMIITALLLFAYGTGKAALMPLHRWLPAAMVAPTPVSALLHAVAVVKAGVFVLLKIGVYIFGLDLLKQSGASQWLFWLAGASILCASLIAMTKSDLKARLAYSTVSQLSYITLGLAIATPLAIIAAALHMLTHAFGKITLFMCAGAIYTATHKRDIASMRGLAWHMPVVFIAFVIGALSITGLPPFGGMWSKFLLLQASMESYLWAGVAILIVSSFLNAIYLVAMGLTGWMAISSSAPQSAQNGGNGQKLNQPLLCVLPPVLTALGCVILFFTLQPIYDFLSLIEFSKQ